MFNLDKKILVAINNCNSAFFDDFFSIYSGKYIWLLTAAAIIFVIFKTQKIREVWAVAIAVALVILLADQISSSLIKPLVCRLRPCAEPSLNGLLNIVCNHCGGWSFPSSHAANGFAFASFTALLFKNRLYSLTIFLWATLTAYSRIYLAMHYPLDILCGIMLGLAVGIFVYYLLEKFMPNCTLRPIGNKFAVIIVSVFVFTLVAMSIFHSQMLILA
ncbi:MAG: phosphatase PAP2 family protein [Prevotellaceae bacterium]|jgi:undecaprenyl-diphosphatase|nr:phosphatase PAP2 family protein [Prevotellaceae bacterium]